MATFTLKVSDNFKGTIEKLPWVNWSELARDEIAEDVRLQEELEKVKKIVSKSKFTEKDADELSEKVKKSMHDDLKRRGLI